MAKTSLAQQLKKLEAPQTHLLVHRKERASFLFNPKEAAAFDRDAFFDLGPSLGEGLNGLIKFLTRYVTGLSGLEELKTLNPNFNGFDNTLFDVTSKSFERSVETPEANEKLNDQIKTFLTLLSPYFLLKPAHKALEWLINRYHIEQFNIDDIMFLILPYYETTYFAQMLQILHIKQDSGRWHWLHPVKMSRVPLAKLALFNRASSDMSFLKFVCDMPAQAIKVHGSRGSNLSTLFAFYATTLIGALHHAKPINELHITHMLPSLLNALSSSLLEYTAFAFMIIACLATKTCLSSKILTVLFNKISKVEHSNLRTESVISLVLLAQNNAEGSQFPEKALARLQETVWFLPCLVSVNKSRVIITPLVKLLLSVALKLVQNGEDKYRVLVESLLTDIRYHEDYVGEIFEVLLGEFHLDVSEDTVKWFSQILKCLEHSYPKNFDTIVSLALSDEESKAGIAVKTILGINTSRNDIFLKLVHPNEDVRVQAIKHIGKHFQPDQLAWLNQTLLDRLRDDSPKVVRQLLRLPEPLLSSLNSDTLLQNLTSVIARFSSSDEPIVMTALTVLFQSTHDESLLLISVIPHILSVLDKTKMIEEFSGNVKFLGLLKKNLSSDSPALSSVWETLSSGREIIPPVKNLVSTLDKWSQLKSHSSFWFSSALLIASKMTDQRSQENGDLVMGFLVDYLKFSEMVSVEGVTSLSPDTLEACLESSRRGQLPVHGALHCLQVLSSSLKAPSGSRRPWIESSLKSSAFSMALYKVLHEGCQAGEKSIRVAFSLARNSFFQSHFPETEQQVLFLLNALIVEPNLGYKCLDLSAKIISADTNLLSTCLKEQSLIVPCLMILLTSPTEAIRSRVLQILTLFTESLSTGFYRPLVEALVDHSTEILLDHEQIEIVAYKLFCSDIKGLLKDEVAKSSDKILQHLIRQVIASVATPAYIKAPLLVILQFVSSKDILLELLPVASKYIGNEDKLNSAESQVVVNIFKRLNESVIDVFTDDKFWNNFKLALADHQSLIQHPDYEKGICPAALILNQITKEVFANIPEPKEKLQEKLLSSILEKVTDVENVQVMTANSSLFKRIVLDARMIVKLLSPMETVIVPYSPSSSLRARKRESSTTMPSLQTLETFEWKKGVCLLELIQNKKQITDIHLLLPAFFSLLKKCLMFEEQGPVEYTKQLLLSSILHCSERLQTVDRSSLVLEGLHVDVIIQCVRSSQNPQTHHHSLLALSYIAHLLPEQVLDNIMEIFTFIGSSVLRQDNAYSFQLISKIIETVIPILVQSQKGVGLDEAVTNVLRVFVSAFLDVPEHRRHPLYKKLQDTLSNGEYLWIFLLLNFEKHVVDYNTQENEEKPAAGSMPKVLKYALRLSSEFPPTVILNTAFKLLDFIIKLPHDKDPASLQNYKDKSMIAIFNVEQHSLKNLRHYKHTLLHFLSTLMSSEQFVRQISELTEEEIHSLKNKFTSIVEKCLVYIKSVTVLVESSTSASPKYWRAILNLCYDILDKTNALLPTVTFTTVIGDLLSHSLEAVRRKAIEILGWRLQQPSPLPQEKLRALLPLLLLSTDCLLSSSNRGGPSSAAGPPAQQEKSRQEDGGTSGQESQITLQAALFAIKLMARHLSSKYLDDFKTVLEKIVTILNSEKSLEGPVMGSLVLCLGELVFVLKAQAVPLLPNFMPQLIRILKKNSNLESGELLLLSCVTAVHKIVEVLSPFLSPYLEKILYHVALLTAKTQLTDSETQQKGQSLNAKLKSIRQNISEKSPKEVLVTAMSGAHGRLMKSDEEEAVGPLMDILSASFSSAADLKPATLQLFLSALDFRQTHPTSSLAHIHKVEDSVIRAFTHLILKLSESSFRPLYQRVFLWATADLEKKERVITFYRLSTNIAKSLKSLFPLFIGIFIENASEMLKLNNPSLGNSEYFSGDSSTEKSVLLVESIVETFLTAFTYDSSQKFLTKEYFNLIMEPLVDQVENRMGGGTASDERCQRLVTPCLARMATATADESLWKQLNHKILLKTRHNLPEVRVIAMRSCCALAAKLGEGFMALLPETIPFLAELLEDDDEEVERECQKVVNEMEEILGESIQKYF